jgi:predicted nucleic acid-binding protein
LTVLLDSCIWIDYIQGEERAKKMIPIIESSQTIIISTINICEIYRHILSKKDLETAGLGINLIADRAIILPLNTETAILAAQLKDKHKLTLGDALILSTSLIYKSKLITFDNHFKNFENCKVY